MEKCMPDTQTHPVLSSCVQPGLGSAGNHELRGTIPSDVHVEGSLIVENHEERTHLTLRHTQHVSAARLTTTVNLARGNTLSRLGH